MIRLQEAPGTLLSSRSGTKERSRDHTERWQPPNGQEKQPRNETYLVGPLILDFSAPRTERNKFLLLKSHLWCFIMVI